MVLNRLEKSEEQYSPFMDWPINPNAIAISL
jgi:hypothetical protein